jgi:starch synthase
VPGARSPGGSDVVLGGPGGIPEVPAIAGGLGRAGLLAAYVTSITESVGGSLGLAGRVPGPLGARMRDILSRRPVPEGVAPERLVHRATAFDLGAAGLIRLTPPALSRRIAFPAYAAFHRRLDLALRRQVTERAGAVISSYGSCLRTFKRAHELDVPTMLLYPIAHHRYAAKLLGEEAHLSPDFANTLQFESLPNRLRMRMEREIELAERVVVYSSFHRRTFLSEGVPEEKLIEIPLGVDSEMFRPAPRDEDGVFRVTFVGQIGQRKGLSYLLDGFRRAAIPRSELLLVGRPIGSTAQWDGLSHVRHLPAQPRSRLPEIYARSDVFVLPSLIEGFPLTALEAMSSGRPAIVSNHTFGGDVVNDGANGFVIPIRDPDAIAERLRLLSEDPDERDRMGNAARSTAEQYTWEKFGDRVAEAAGRLTVSDPEGPAPEG